MSKLISRLCLAAVLGFGAMTVTASFVAPAHAEDRGHRWEHDRGGHRYGGYRGGGRYYAAPPVVYQPRGYHAQPGASVNLNFPLRF